MKDRICLLSEQVSNQIAAGEVVQSPASVVKEMVENSIDAGSKEIIVNYRRGGHDLVQIVDDGIGMSPNDARMAFEKHATSKISKSSDLFALSTYGFRGEALASIAAVSQVELRTRPHDAEMGTLTVINGGDFQNQEPVMCSPGSQFCIRNVFYSVPARRKFMDNPKRCANKIKKEFQRVALCYPEIGFELYGDDKPIYQLRPSTLAGRIVDVVGRSIKNNLLEISANTTIVKLRGFISHTDAAKKSSYDQFLFVNGRYFHSTSINSAILRAYEKLINPELNPSFFLYLEVDPARIDVNVHPQKTDIRFADADEIWQIVNAAARETLAKTGAVPLMDFDDESNLDIPVLQRGVQYTEPRAMMNESYNPFEVEQSVGVLKAPVSTMEYATQSSSSSHRGALKASIPDSDVWEQGFEEYESSANSAPNNFATTESYEWESYEPATTQANDASEAQQQQQLKIEEPHSIHSSQHLGEVIISNEYYAWCKIGANMQVFDLRRAKERVLFNHYMSMVRENSPVCQTILFPIELGLNDTEYSLVDEYMMDLIALGFNIEVCGNSKIQVLGAPADVALEGIDQLLYELLRLLESPENTEEQRTREMAAVMAQNAARHSSRRITPHEAREILTQLLAIEENGVTASGRKISWAITKEDIKKKI